MTFEPLSLDKLRPPAARNPGPATQLQWVELADCLIDRSYQRDLAGTSQKHIESIAANFEWSCFAPLIVAPLEGGKFAIIDGQHRATGALLVGLKKAPALVVIADRQGQARAFAAINGQTTKMNVLSVYRAARAAGDPATLEIDAIAQSQGVRILTYPVSAANQKPGDSIAIASILRMRRQCGAEALRAAFAAIMASRGDKRGLVNPLNVKALSTLFQERPMQLETVRKAFGFIDLRAAHRRALDQGIMGEIVDMRNELKRALAKLAGRSAT